MNAYANLLANRQLAELRSEARARRLARAAAPKGRLGRLADALPLPAFDAPQLPRLHDYPTRG